MSVQAKEIWAVGDAYEAYVGRWSRLVAREFIERLGAPSGLRWLDVGCGTGALSQTVLDRCAPAALAGIDPSEGFIAHARRHTTDPRAEFRVGDARTLPVEDAAFDIAVSGLVLNFVPDPAKAVAEMTRAVRPLTGVVSAYVWDYAGEMQMMRHFWDAAVALDPTARDKIEGSRFPLCRPEPLRDLWLGAGLGEVEVRAIDAPTVFRDFDDYWSPFLGGQGPAPAYCMSLPLDKRHALRERLRSTLPSKPDGSIRLIARAWAVRGKRPG
ncbi:MAG TPA: class I SAM-dependent methyltransferase [Azospirillaceae bacterium]|nr:class I SAM-dependent methyltransferase [Azospirillaceae bacterium]